MTGRRYLPMLTVLRKRGRPVQYKPIIDYKKELERSLANIARMKEILTNLKGSI